MSRLGLSQLVAGLAARPGFASSRLMRNRIPLTAALAAAVFAPFAFHAAHAEAEDPASAWSIVADLTTELGPRPAGSPREARARDWAAARLKALGFKNVVVEPFTMKAYVRGIDKAR